MDAATSHSFVDALYRKTLLSVKASNGIPSEDEDFHFHMKFNSKFAQNAQQNAKRVQDLIWQLTRPNDPERRQQGGEEDDDDDDDTDDEDAKALFEGPEANSKVTDFVDTLLDDALKQLECFEKLKTNATSKANQLAGQKQTKNTTGGESAADATRKCLENTPMPEFARSKAPTGTPAATTGAAQREQQVAGKSRAISKPQELFDEQIDNSEARFVCKLRGDKPHALQNQEGDQVMQDDEEEMLYHPYRHEITSIKYSPWQLQAAEEPSKRIPIEEASYKWVDNEEALLEMLHELLKPENRVVAIDLEHHSYRSYLGIVCLMQISVEAQDWLVDTLALRSKLQILNQVFCDPAKVKVLHGADMDILWLQRDLGLYIVNMFDTGQAARLLQYQRFSLAFLLKKFCDIDADKQYQLADWRVRPLDNQMVKYAREDTRFLLFIYDQMKVELIENSAQTKMSLLMESLQNSQKLCLQVYEKPTISDEDCESLANRLKGTVGLIGSLSDLQMRVFHVLYNWRDRKAREYDESHAFVLPNHMLIKLTKYIPTRSDQLFRTCHPVPALVRKHAQELLGLISTEKAKVEKQQQAEAQQQTPVSKMIMSVESTPDEKQEWTPLKDADQSPMRIGNVQQLCEYAGWQSGKRKAKCLQENSSSKTANSLSPMAVSLRLDFSDSQVGEEENEHANLRRVHEMLARTTFVVSEMEQKQEDASSMDVDDGDDHTQPPQDETMDEITASLPKSISEVYHLSNKAKKRRVFGKDKAVKGSSALKQEIDSTHTSEVKTKTQEFMKEIGWVKSENQEQQASSSSTTASTSSSSFVPFDYVAASAKIKEATFVMEKTDDDQQKQKDEQAKKRAYNPFIAMKPPRSAEKAKPAGKKKLYQPPRSSTFR